MYINIRKSDFQLLCLVQPLFQVELASLIHSTLDLRAIDIAPILHKLLACTGRCRSRRHEHLERYQLLKCLLIE